VRIKGDILTHARLLSLLEFPPAAYRRRQESRFHNFILIEACLRQAGEESFFLEESKKEGFFGPKNGPQNDVFF